MQRLLIGLLLLLPMRAGAEPVTLTLEQAIARATAEHPQVRASESRRRQAEFGLQGAGALPPAQLGVGSWQGRGDALLNANYLGLNRPDYYLFAQQPFRPLGETVARKALAGAEVQSAEAQLQGQRLQLRQQVKDAYISVLASQRQLELARESLHLADELYRLTSARLQAGASPRMDQLSASLQRNRAEQDVHSSQQQVLQSQARLAPLVGVPAGEEIRCSAEGLPTPRGLTLEGLRAAAQQHPRLQAARAALAVSGHSRELAERQGSPTPGLQAIYDAVHPSFALQFTLSIPLDWGTLGAEVAQRREAESERQALLDGETRQIDSDLAQAYHAFVRAQEQVQAYEEKLLGPAEELVKVTRYGYERGALPYLQLLTVQQQLSSLRRDYAQRWLEAYLAWNALETAGGIP